MGRFWNEYNEALQKIQEIKEHPVDPVQDPEGYAAQMKEERKAEYRRTKQNRLLMQTPIPNQLFREVWEKYYPPERRQALDLEKAIQNAQFKRLRNYFRKNKLTLPARREGESQEQHFVRAAKELGLNDELTIGANLCILDYVPQEARNQFYEELDSRLEKEQPEVYNSMLSQMDASVDIYNLPPEKQVTHPHEKEVQDLREKFEAELSGDPEKLSKVKEALDYSNEYLTLVYPEAAEEMDGQEMTNETIRLQTLNHALENQDGGLFDGKYTGMIQKQKFSNIPFSMTPGGKPDLVEEFVKEKRPEISGETKEGIRKLYKKMTEMGILGKEGTEAQGKVYALQNVHRDKKRLEEALKAGNADEIIAAKEAYQKSREDVQELMEIAKQYFAQGSYNYPGNMNGHRHTYLPFDLMADLRTHSQVNGFYTLFNGLMLRGVSLEEYLQDPFGKVYHSALKEIEEGSFEKVMANKSFEETLDVLFVANERDNFMYKKSTDPRILGRSLEAMLHSEKDDRKRKDMLVYGQKLYYLISDTKTNQCTLFDMFSDQLYGDTPEIRALKNMRVSVLENLITVADGDRKTEELMVLPNISVYGKVKKPFSIDQYLDTHEPDYKGIKERTDQLFLSIEKAENQTNCVKGLPDMTMAREAAFNAIMRVLTKNLEKDGNKKEFIALEQKAEKLVKDMPQDTPEAKQMKERFQNYYLGKDLKLEKERETEKKLWEKFDQDRKAASGGEPVPEEKKQEEKKEEIKTEIKIEEQKIEVSPEIPMEQASFRASEPEAALPEWKKQDPKLNVQALYGDMFGRYVEFAPKLSENDHKDFLKIYGAMLNLDEMYSFCTRKDPLTGKVPAFTDEISKGIAYGNGVLMKEVEQYLKKHLPEGALTEKALKASPKDPEEIRFLKDLRLLIDKDRNMLCALDMKEEGLSLEERVQKARQVSADITACGCASKQVEELVSKLEKADQWVFFGSTEFREMKDGLTDVIEARNDLFRKDNLFSRDIVNENMVMDVTRALQNYKEVLLSAKDQANAYIEKKEAEGELDRKGQRRLEAAREYLSFLTEEAERMQRFDTLTGERNRRENEFQVNFSNSKLMGEVAKSTYGWNIGTAMEMQYKRDKNIQTVQESMTDLSAEAKQELERVTALGSETISKGFRGRISAQMAVMVMQRELSDYNPMNKGVDPSADKLYEKWSAHKNNKEELRKLSEEVGKTKEFMEAVPKNLTRAQVKNFLDHPENVERLRAAFKANVKKTMEASKAKGKEPNKEVKNEKKTDARKL